MTGPEPRVSGPEETRLATLAQGLALSERYPSTPQLPLDAIGWAQAPEQVEASLRGAAAVEEAFGRLAPGRTEGHAAWGDTEPGVVTLQVSEFALQKASHPEFSYAAHEAGHMFGLSDEYEGAKHSANTGGISGADAGVEAPVTDRDTSSVLSKGRDVLPAHYFTFWEVLTRMTAGYLAPSDWRIGK
jgi:hypothetical protein